MMNKKTERKISNRKMYQNSLSQMPHRYKIVQDMIKRLKKNSYLHTYNMLFAFEYKTRVFELSALSELKLYQVENWFAAIYCCTAISTPRVPIVSVAAFKRTANRKQKVI